MRLATFLTLALSLPGCAERRLPLSTAPLPAATLPHEVLLVDLAEGSTDQSGETIVSWTPRSTGCRISFVAKSTRDQGLKRIEFLDSQNQPAGFLDIAPRPDDKWLAGSAVLTSRSKVHFKVPRPAPGAVVSVMVEEDLTSAQWQELQNHGVGACVQVDTGPGRTGSPMVRSVGHRVDLQWQQTEPKAAQLQTSINLTADATVLDKVWTTARSGNLSGKNLGSIQFHLQTHPGQRHRFNLAFR